MKISLCIITLNEEVNLPRCLTSVALVVDEIIVVDSGSADGTEGVAREFGARWVHQDWLGFVKQKNFALSLASHDWVLSLDADEALSPDLFSSSVSGTSSVGSVSLGTTSQDRTPIPSGKSSRN